MAVEGGAEAHAGAEEARDGAHGGAGVDLEAQAPPPRHDEQAGDAEQHEGGHEGEHGAPRDHPVLVGAHLQVDRRGGRVRVRGQEAEAAGVVRGLALLRGEILVFGRRLVVRPSAAAEVIARAAAVAAAEERLRLRRRGRGHVLRFLRLQPVPHSVDGGAQHVLHVG